MAYGVGHQNADHTHLAEMTVADQSPRLCGVAGVMPWATDEKLHISLLCEFD
jgi:hypothetical protein